MPMASVSLPGPDARSSTTRRGGPPAAHRGDSGQRLQRADQNAAGHALRFGDEVQTFVHAVDEVDVGVAGRAEDNARAIGWAAPGVRGAIADAQIRFHFHDSSGRAAMHQDLSQAIARHFDRRARVEIALEQRGAGENLSDGNRRLLLVC